MMFRFLKKAAFALSPAIIFLICIYFYYSKSSNYIVIEEQQPEISVEEAVEEKLYYMNNYFSPNIELKEMEPNQLLSKISFSEESVSSSTEELQKQNELSEIHKLLEKKVPVPSYFNRVNKKHMQDMIELLEREDEDTLTEQIALLKDFFGEKFVSQLMSFDVNDKWNGTTTIKPTQIIIVSNFRSGSSFFHGILTSHRGVFGNYQPELFFDIPFRTETSEYMPLLNALIRNILKCRYPDTFLKFALSFLDGVLADEQWKSACNFTFMGKNNEKCLNKTIYEAQCSVLPIKVVKFVRVEMKAMLPLLEDKSLNVHVVYLVRDPRPVMHSRMTSVNWCIINDCRNVTYLCDVMDKDLNAFQNINKRFPDRMHLVRYEDLCLNPFEVIQELMDKLKLGIDDQMNTFLETHTTTHVNNPLDLHRITSEQVLKWVPEISLKRLEQVQSECSQVMLRFGYLPIESTKNISVTDVLKPVDLTL